MGFRYVWFPPNLSLAVKISTCEYDSNEVHWVGKLYMSWLLQDAPVREIVGGLSRDGIVYYESDACGTMGESRGFERGGVVFEYGGE